MSDSKTSGSVAQGSVPRPFTPNDGGSSPLAPTKVEAGKVSTGVVGIPPGQVGAHPLPPNPEPPAPAGAPPRKEERLGLSSIARMAGNIASGYAARGNEDAVYIAQKSVEIAREIARVLER